jgi:hypothetical protein
VMPTRLALLRFLASRRALLLALSLSAIVLAHAAATYRHDASHGVGRALGLFASAAVPLLAYVTVSAMLGPGGLARSGRPLVRLGASPWRVALGTIVASALVSACLAGALGGATVLVAHGTGDPPVVRDTLQTLGLSALAGASYATYFMAGGAIAQGLWARPLLLVLDWVLGEAGGFGALLTPRAHLGNVLGGDAPFDVPPAGSLAALVVIMVVATLWSLLRVRHTTV